MLRPFGTVYDEEKQLSRDRQQTRTTTTRNNYRGPRPKIINQARFDEFLRKAAQHAAERREKELEEAAEDERRRRRYGNANTSPGGHQPPEGGNAQSGSFVPRFDAAADYYSVLAVLHTATAAEIRSKYKKLALMHHPDKQAGKTDQEIQMSKEIFREVQEAFDILSDPEQRRAYDDRLTGRPSQATRGQQFSSSKCPPAQVALWVSLEELCFGGSRTITRLCRTIRDGDLCKETRTHTVIIKKGMADGSRVVLPGVGDRTDMRKRQGDVEVIIREEPHSHLTRSGVKDLIVATSTTDDGGAPSAVGGLFFCKAVVDLKGRHHMVVGSIVGDLLGRIVAGAIPGNVAKEANHQQSLQHQETSPLSAGSYPEVMRGSVILKGLGMPDPEAPWLAPHGDIIVEAFIPVHPRANAAFSCHILPGLPLPPLLSPLCVSSVRACFCQLLADLLLRRLAAALKHHEHPLSMSSSTSLLKHHDTDGDIDDF